jgi:hypothetical protein
MDLRIRELGALDPLAVPLPNGTEVTTRVDRVLSPERRVPQGAVGRVVAQRGDELDVMVVGVGVLRYARSELVPRKIGQVRYARRRADGWEALRPCTIVEATVGSRGGPGGGWLDRYARLMALAVLLQCSVCGGRRRTDGPAGWRDAR